ncbi:zinc transporter permease subunit ZevB [Rodentibacter caecimuris]|uniref:Nickel/cobalt efflux system n=1 Tax=Rodentibacter caecimuris TaxID=1796644 RepID=A0ABX3KZU6_9PAST|nr:cobalt transporter [Rodentibacter heylii]
MKWNKNLLILCLLIGIIFWGGPWLFIQVAQWQKVINQLMSGYLHQIKDQDTQIAGVWLIVVSFCYGVLHAVGPGHGKFIIGSYLSTHQSRLKNAMGLSFLSSLVQGIVAIMATSVLVVVLKLSSSYFKLSQLWLERSAFILLLLLGFFWCYQSLLKFWLSKKTKRLKINRINSAPLSPIKNIVKNDRTFVANYCSCGHQHLPDNHQLQLAQDWRSKCLIILSIGMRPCSGAIFILFLSYMLDLYFWGILAALVMSFGTGLTLSAFALLVIYARKTAIKLGNWYGSPKFVQQGSIWGKLLAGSIMIFFATSLLYASTLPVRGGAAIIG